MVRGEIVRGDEGEAFLYSRLRERDLSSHFRVKCPTHLIPYH